MKTNVRAVDKKIRELGYVFVRQTGSHMLYKHPATGATVVMPSTRGLQGGDVRFSTVKHLMRRAVKGAKS